MTAQACWFGADFFFLLMFPRQSYPRWYQSTKKAMAVTICVGVFAAALGSTIVVARNSAQILHVPDDVKRAAQAYYFRPPLQYRDWAVNIAYVCLLWPGWLACVASTVLMFLADTHDLRHGTNPLWYGAAKGDGPANPSAVGPLRAREDGYRTSAGGESASTFNNNGEGQVPLSTATTTTTTTTSAGSTAGFNGARTAKEGELPAPVTQAERGL